MSTFIFKYAMSTFPNLDWFQTWRGIHQGCILPPCLFNLYAEYIMRNSGLEEAQAGIKIARRNINNLNSINIQNFCFKIGIINRMKKA